ncbi:hypothetical protein EV421DRAFT_1829620 [Armillaria borealis]|uniref:Uncharacterized protein n=1 Tax=Armillaria borealis TaxID=47425 RepID=A0AA39J6J1_9AGAR|nr:hypothetical protein EV421DRAFT_1829620 [Armillaria borealis]
MSWLLLSQVVYSALVGEWGRYSSSLSVWMMTGILGSRRGNSELERREMVGLGEGIVGILSGFSERMELGIVRISSCLVMAREDSPID